MIRHIGIFLVAICAGSSHLIAANSNLGANSGITATGTCVKKVTQDRVSISLVASALESNAGQAAKMATQIHQKIRSEIESLKLKDSSFQTSFTLGEEFDYSQKKPISKGFRSNVSLIVETSEIARIGDVIGLAVKHGAKNVSDLTTFISTERYKSEYESCLEVASRNAKDKAVKLASGVGVRLGKVIAIDEGQNRREPVYAGRAMAKAMSFDSSADSDMSSGPAVDAKVVDMVVSATVTFESN